MVNRAKIILELDEEDNRKPLTQAQIAEKIEVARQTVNDAKKAFIAAESISEFLQRKKRETPPVKPKITGEVEAHIIALACSPVPEGHGESACWLKSAWNWGILIQSRLSPFNGF